MGNHRPGTQFNTTPSGIAAEAATARSTSAGVSVLPGSPAVVSRMLGGLQLVMLGIIGEYLWRNYEETRNLPRFVAEATHGLSEEVARELTSG